MRVEAYISKIRKGYHVVRIYISDGKELLHEEHLDYSNINTARKKLSELKRKYNLKKQVYPNNFIVFENNSYTGGIK